MSVSKTVVPPEAVAALARRFDIHPWEKKGAPRYYLNLDALGDIIGLKQSFYKTGYCSGCSYINMEGYEVTVAHARAYGKGQFSHKTYICENRVHCDWEPYGADIAELIAVRIAQSACDGNQGGSVAEGL